MPSTSSTSLAAAVVALELAPNDMESSFCTCWVSAQEGVAVFGHGFAAFAADRNNEARRVATVSLTSPASFWGQLERLDDQNRLITLVTMMNPCMTFEDAEVVHPHKGERLAGLRKAIAVPCLLSRST